VKKTCSFITSRRASIKVVGRLQCSPARDKNASLMRYPFGICLYLFPQARVRRYRRSGSPLFDRLVNLIRFHRTEIAMKEEVFSR